MYHSYVMGIDESIYTLEHQGFEINRDGGNFMVTFPRDRAVRMIINEECGIFSPIIMICFSNCREAMENV